MLPLHAPLDVGRDLAALQEALWQIRVYLPATLAGKRRDTIRFLPGRHWHEFSDASRAAFAGQGVPHQPAVRSHGLPAAGARAGHGATAPDAVGSGLLRHRAGASGGEAIILMADRQTTGGYPKIAQIASVDLPALAQSLPGQELRFQQIELDEAQRLDVERERAFAQLRDALAPMRALL